SYYRIDRIDERDRVRTSALGRARDHCDIRHIWGQLHDYRNFRHFLDPSDYVACVARILTDRGAHSALAHSVWTSKVELEPVSPGVLRALHDIMPRLLIGLDHQRDD